MPNHQRYEVIELVARGGMGVVYKARHRHKDCLDTIFYQLAKVLYRGLMGVDEVRHVLFQPGV